MLKALTLKITLLDRRVVEASAEAARTEALLHDAQQQVIRLREMLERERAGAISYTDSDLDPALFDRFFLAQEKKIAELDLGIVRIQQEITAARTRVRTLFNEKERFRLLKEQEECRILTERLRKETAERDEAVLVREIRKSSAEEGDV